jgi:hypothetical protein
MAEIEHIHHKQERLQGSVPKDLQAYPQFVIWRQVEIGGKIKRFRLIQDGRKSIPYGSFYLGKFSRCLESLRKRSRELLTINILLFLILMCACAPCKSVTIFEYPGK